MTAAAQSELPGEGGFRKKSFTPRTFLRGVVRSLRNGPALMRAHRAGRVSEQLVEKIMLATTAVNECQYCARFHTRRASQVGVDEDVIDAILEQDIGEAIDESERTALLFAQRYAETDEDPGEKAVAELEAEYGSKMAADIQAYVRAIYFGNLLGNSYDALRYWIRNTVADWMEKLHHATTE